MTRSRKPSCARGAPSGASRVEAPWAPGCTGSPPTPASTRSRGGPSECFPSTTARPATRATTPASRWTTSTWIEPYPDGQVGLQDGFAGPESRYEQREAVELAFIAALQHLPARQRAALILRDVLGFSAREVAESLTTSVASVNSALQRARKTIDERLPERSQQATLRSLGDARVSDLVERFIDAFERGDVEAILAMIAEDATFSMPPYPDWCRGRDAIADSWLMPGGPATTPALRHDARQRSTGGGHLPAGARVGRYVPIALDVLTLAGPEIAAVVAFRTPHVFARFGLRDQLPSS